MKHFSILVALAVLVGGAVILPTNTWPGSQAVAQTPPDADAVPVDDALFATGESEFAICAACHGASGEGGVGPAFADNAELTDAHLVIETILFGKDVMPAFGDQFDDEQVAAAATYIRNSWGNEFGGVAVDDVASIRAAGAPAQ